MFASFCLYTRPVGRRQTTTHWRASSPYGAGPGPESSQYRRNLCSLSLIHHVSVRWRAPWRRTLIKRKRAHFQNEFSHIRGRPPCFTPKWKMYSGQWTMPKSAPALCNVSGVTVWAEFVYNAEMMQRVLKATNMLPLNCPAIVIHALK